jgi:tyrosyl-tRNA synthetase
MLHELESEIEIVAVTPSPDALDGLFASHLKPPVSLWGVAPVAPLHLGIDILIVAQRSLLRSVGRHIIILADLHAMMTHELMFSEVAMRSSYYEHYLRKCCGLEGASFIRGSEFQNSIEYTEPLLALANQFCESELRSHFPAAAKGAKSPRLSQYLYLLMQCLDVVFLGADLIFAGHGQRKLYALLESFDLNALTRLGQRSFHGLWSRAREPGATVGLYSALGHDIMGRPLTASTSETRISIHETREGLERKVNSMYAPPVEQLEQPGRVNALLQHFRYSVFPWQDEPVWIRARSGARTELVNYDTFHDAYRRGEIHPADCKEALADCLWRRLREVQTSWNTALLGWLEPGRMGVPSRGAQQ